MKQTIQIRRTETRTIQLEVPQALARATLTVLANDALTAATPTVWGKTVGASMSDWSVASATPECSCETDKKKPARR